MDHPICRQCGVQYHAERYDPATCPVCSDERQYVRWGGQAWVTMPELEADRVNRRELVADGITAIDTAPSFGIGQRALLVRTAAGNVLWDCITLLDDTTRAAVAALGGIDAIAISHPHYYGSMVEWSEAFGGVPIYIHAADRAWVPRPDGNVVLWEGEVREIVDGVTLINAGIHFDGGTVLHWAEGGGALLSGDIFQVVMDRQWVSFMYSYPNLIPERPAVVRRALDRVAGYRFADIHGAFRGRTVRGDGEQRLAASAERYLRVVGGS